MIEMVTAFFGFISALVLVSFAVTTAGARPVFATVAPSPSPSASPSPNPSSSPGSGLPGLSLPGFDPQNPNHVAVVMDVPDLDAFTAAMQTEAAAEAMAHDGVMPETLVILVAE